MPENKNVKLKIAKKYDIILEDRYFAQNSEDEYMKNKFLETGKIVGTHGVRGMLRVQPWCDSSDFLTEFSRVYTDSNGKNQLKVLSAKPHGGIVLMSVDGVTTIEEAEKLRGQVIYINRDDVDLPEGRYFISDLIGCTVTDADTGATLGILADVSQTGANDVWHIKKEEREYLVPAIESVIVSVTPDEDSIVIRPLKGIFDDEN